MKKHFFLIDDDEDELEIFSEAISRINVPSKCTYAPNAGRALQMLKYLVPDYIFIDINMPKSDGFACLKEIRQNPDFVNCCIVMYSNGIADDMINRASEAGANACVKKTDSIEGLATEIEKLIWTEVPSMQ